MADLIIGIVFLIALGVALYIVMQYSDKIRRGMIDELEDEQGDEPTEVEPTVVETPEPEAETPTAEAPAPEVQTPPAPKKQRRDRPKKKKD
jgi:cytoskeletal protein RodZ